MRNGIPVLFIFFWKFRLAELIDLQIRECYADKNAKALSEAQNTKELQEVRKCRAVWEKY